MKIALAQTNPTIGDISGNVSKLVYFIRSARDAGAELVVFPELSLIGYPPKDLLLKPRFIDDNLRALDDIAAACADIAALVGFAGRHHGSVGRTLHNAAAFIADGQIQNTYYKQLLPTYDVFDESRYFEPASSDRIVAYRGLRLGLTICEDIWNEPGTHNAQRPLYHATPLADLAAQKVDWVVNMSASPFVIGKHALRCDLFARQCKKYGLPLLYVNQIGGNDELVFDGNSCAFDIEGRLIAQARAFQEDLLLVDLQGTSNGTEPFVKGAAEVHAALVLGLQDYVRKCGFQKTVLGLSGGIDSALTAAIAVEALGSDNVLGIAMPSRFSSAHSLEDARQLAENLGIRFEVIPIEPAHDAMEKMLSAIFSGRTPDSTEENIQARVRGNILMAISNKFGHLLLTTGNKSELAVGYCTLYGDMAGGLAVISDVPKTMVYELAGYCNRQREIIPASTMTKPPSAELRPDQTDQDLLPPYEVLDAILQRYVELEQSRDEIVIAGFAPDTVEKVIGLVDRNEYKRKQAAPGLKVTSRAFGFGRRMPIAQRYRAYKGL